MCTSICAPLRTLSHMANHHAKLSSYLVSESNRRYRMVVSFPMFALFRKRAKCSLHLAPQPAAHRPSHRRRRAGRGRCAGILGMLSE